MHEAENPNFIIREGGRRVESGCTVCQMDCPCPQACERSEPSARAGWTPFAIVVLMAVLAGLAVVVA